ncbi:hypothetical protein CHU98_g3355 [Xylaria longipes]|nr:hypothetical protein CHU98_g3355 [Xylaria longipes]
MDVSLLDRARSLVANLALQCSSNKDFGSMSSSIYDTAWLAMVRKTNGEDVAWLFPECFEFILEDQLPSGGWNCYSTPVDGILNTAAALLALRRHLKTCPGNIDWLERSTKAEKALSKMLDSLDVDTADQVGFEILIVKHVELLRDEGVSLETRNFEALRSVRDEKLAMLPPTSVYNFPSTLYHSLEALIGHIDFDQISRWREPNGSMMGSPSSTASYLMYTSSWDDAAETYLKNVLEYGSGHGNGSVPSAWPSSLFEISWVVATLLEVGVNIADDHVEIIGTYLQQALETGKGTVGFAPGSLPDADDTAKALITLCNLGYNRSAEGLLRAFETRDHFITYPNERNPSFSTNCHVLISLLTVRDPSRYSSQIQKATIYLTSRAFAGDWRDKWNRSEYYPMMLLVKAYELLYCHPDIARELFKTSPGLEEQIPIITLDCLSRLLLRQEISGAWDDTCEVTSYAILTLASLLSLPWMQQIEVTAVVAAAARGKEFLHSQRNQWSYGHHLWIEKVNYAYDTLSEAYCLSAALVLVDLAPSTSIHATEYPFMLPEDMLGQMKRAGHLIFRTSLMTNLVKGVQLVLEVQAGYYFCLLQRNPISIFPHAFKRKSSYQVVIPLAFTACVVINNNYKSLNLQLLQEMMVLSNLNFLVDEYMEGVIDNDLWNNRAVTNLIENLFAKGAPSKEAQYMNGNISGGAAEKVQELGNSGQHDSPSDITTILTRVVGFVLNHAAVQASPECYQDRLAFDLKACLLAHVTQAQDNYVFMRKCGPTESEVSDQDSLMFHSGAPQAPLQYTRPGRTFYNWVRGTSADHTSCPFSFIFFNSLMYSTAIHHKTNLFGNPRSAYIAEDLCRHLSSLCRMYNDYGSLQRDMKEMNLNSVNFPEFAPLPSNSVALDNPAHAKSELLWVAEYERRGVEGALAMLSKEFADENQRYIIDGLRFFVNITDMFGQIYVLKDVGIRNE